MFVSKSYQAEGNLTRGEYGDIPEPIRVSWTHGEWVEDPNGTSWGVWDSQEGLLAPWPEEDVDVEGNGQ